MRCVVVLGCPFECCDIDFGCPYILDQCVYYPYVFPWWYVLIGTLGFLFLVMLITGLCMGMRRRRALLRMQELDRCVEVEMPLPPPVYGSPVYGSPVYEPLGPYQGQPYQGQPYSPYQPQPSPSPQSSPQPHSQPYS